MIVVRYAALLALVVWVGGLALLELVVAPPAARMLSLSAPVAGHEIGGAAFVDILRQFSLLSYACGAVLLASFVTLKLVGPPPRAFVARLAIVVVMLGVAMYSGLYAFSAALMAVNVALGLILVGWYAHE